MDAEFVQLSVILNTTFSTDQDEYSHTVSLSANLALLVGSCLGLPNSHQREDTLAWNI